MAWLDGWFGKRVGTITEPPKKIEYLEGDYSSRNADGSRNYEWGWYPADTTGQESSNGWVTTGRTRTKHGRSEFEATAGIWFGKNIRYWFFKDEKGQWYHADPP